VLLLNSEAFLRGKRLESLYLLIDVLSSRLACSSDAHSSLDQLRSRALDAATGAKQKDPREAKRLYYERSRAVREYVLARAAGVCESCGNPAPFERFDGTTYLEPHHTRRISDGGPDHPRWVAAVCPNCHKEIHHGVRGEEKNNSLQTYLTAIED
jgi:5-methylcytosine-specific restriction enzyme A